MNAAWRTFLDELERWRDAGRGVAFWWRDDDAGRPAPALSRLLALSQRTATPLALAAVPAQAERATFESSGPLVTVLQHGTDHRNRAGTGEKKTEFPASESVLDALARLASARVLLAERAQARFVPVLAPPWNRLPAALASQLAAAGMCGVSQFGVRKAGLAAPGVVQANTHVDLIAWRGDRGFAGEELVLAAATRHLAEKREGGADPGEPTGWLSHHAVHDEASWSFLERLFDAAGAIQGVRWLGAREIFHSS